MTKRLFSSILLLSACNTLTSAPVKDNFSVFPVETAREDGDWTLLERIMPWGDVAHIMIPSSWTPENLKDDDLLTVEVSRDKNTAIIKLERFEPSYPKTTSKP